MEVARWIAFQVYVQNPYIKPPRARKPTEYVRFPWEGPTREEAVQAAHDCRVTPEEVAELNKIFEQLRKEREEPNNG